MTINSHAMARGVPGSGPKKKGTVRDFLGAFAPQVAMSLPGGGD